MITIVTMMSMMAMIMMITSAIMIMIPIWVDFASRFPPGREIHQSSYGFVIPARQGITSEVCSLRDSRQAHTAIVAESYLNRS